ncbi:hypothetical protein N7532_006872 [Penicillium argentinense]|uniref:Multicopper oxidase n=1 Tax=Penicillium argentinense TaxID=1131581 RepID=A0A9W9KBP4_9EURO|nr:uncharacterized protein N7532_006872 [Penicillium argentinense]KAJ5099871.1 hypothetical protein N7532_006872 [Penicillium argentinense]
MRPNSQNLFLIVFCLIQWAEAANVFFPLVLTWQNTSVAGNVRPVIHSNFQFPGPELRINQGDRVQFAVTNLCPFNVTVHFHGIEQLGTPWSDGVPGSSQRPIVTGQSFLYRWTATEYGAYMYHAHHRGQFEDGLYGPIYITPTATETRPFSLVATNNTQLQAMLAAERKTSPVLLSDWRLLTSEEVWAAEVASGVDSYCVNALLINGKGAVSCLPRALINSLITPNVQAVLGNETLTDIACFPPNVTIVQGDYPHNYDAIPPTMFSGCTPTQGEQEVFTVNANQQFVSWDLTSASGHLHLIFSVDEHDMWVYAIDGRYIEPVRVNAINLPNANRYSVLVPLNKPRGDYAVRLISGSQQQILNTTGILRYQGKPQLNRPSNPWVLLNGLNATADTVFLNDSQTIPFPVVTPSATVDQTFKLTIQHFNASYLWTLGNSSFNLELEESQPLLFNQTAIPSDLIIRTKNNTWVDLIIIHPIHKHSNKHFVIGSGTGAFNYSTVAEAMQEIPEAFNLVNPQIRDTTDTVVAIFEPTWLVLRYQVVNPGAFLLHCHVQVHQSGGMALAILDGVDAWPTIPPGYLLDSGFF